MGGKKRKGAEFTRVMSRSLVEGGQRSLKNATMMEAINAQTQCSGGRAGLKDPLGNKAAKGMLARKNGSTCTAPRGKEVRGDPG